MDKFEISFVDSIANIGRQSWNEICGTENPFTRYEFLHALELSGCTTGATGWAPHHIAVHSVSGQAKTLEAVMPMYLKTNSYGEYVFDWAWANAYQSHGQEYYPKFVSSVPFTPSVGQRLFCRNPKAMADIARAIQERVFAKASEINASSWHILFPTPGENELFNELGVATRIGSQFHWYNKDYGSFDDFLATLNTRKRKSIRKERKRVTEQGIDFRTTPGADISAPQWQNFEALYQSTYKMRGMQGYLNREFFELLSKTMPEQVFMITAMQGGKDIAAALFFKSADKLFGRYWGAARDYPFLHFETCYYQGQEYCIQHGLKSFDSGAQGEHKIQRGFEPIVTYSNHWLSHPSFANAVDNFLVEEKSHILNYIEQARTLLPFKKRNE